MATFAVPVRSDRWQLAGPGPLTLDAGGAALRVYFGPSAPAPGAKVASIKLGGSGIENRYSYEGNANVYLRLSGRRSGEPIEITVLKDGGSAPAIVPFVPDKELSAIRGTNLTGAAGALLDGAAKDAGDTLAISAAVDAAGAFTLGSAKTLAKGGALTINANGSYTYAPTGAAILALKAGEKIILDPVTVTVTASPSGLTTQFVLNIEVAGLNSGPTAVNDTATVVRTAASVAGNFLTDGTDDSHPQGEQMWVAKINGAFFSGGLPIKLASGAAITVNGVTGAWVYNPNNRAAGAEVITYTLVDRHGATANGTLTITVNNP